MHIVIRCRYIHMVLALIIDKKVTSYRKVFKSIIDADEDQTISAGNGL